MCAMPNAATRGEANQESGVRIGGAPPLSLRQEGSSIPGLHALQDVKPFIKSDICPNCL